MSEGNRFLERERGLLRPWISLDPGPVLICMDAKGKLRGYELDALGLANLGLSIAEAQAALHRRDLNDAVQPGSASAAQAAPNTTSVMADRG